MKTYFYDDEVKTITRNGRKIEKFIVYEIEHKEDNIDIAERKVKTFACRLGRKLAEGLFTDNGIPYDFKQNYMVVKVPYSTRTRPYDKKDKFIIGLIEAESNMKYEIF